MIDQDDAANQGRDEFGDLPDPDAGATAAELAQAATFGAIIDQALVDRTPPAMSADQRGLVDAAMVIRASGAGQRALAADRQRGLIDAALAAAAARRSRVVHLERAAAELDRADAALASRQRDELAARRASRRTPWLVAGAASAVAIAALALLYLQRSPPPPAQRVAAPAATLPRAWQTRPSDELVGVIPRAAAGGAADRIDVLFADRLGGFRDRQLAVAVPMPAPRRPGGGVP